ncbi:MAG: hypothetical protein R6U52_00380 [Kosmotogaceae bacterium]
MHKSSRKTGMNYVLLLMIAAIVVVGIVLTILLWPKPEPEIVISANSPRPNNASQITYSKNVELYWEVEYDRPRDDLYADIWAGNSEDSLETIETRIQGESTAEAENIFKFNYELPAESHETYYWKVKVYNDAEKSDESDVWSFTLKNSAPEKPVLLKPQDNETDVAMVGFNLEWEEAVDPDGDSVKYDVFLGKSRNLGSSNIIAENIEKTNLLVTNELLNGVLDPDTNYYWKVRATDPENLTSESNTKSFITEVIPPLDVSLISPEDNATGVEIPVNFEWELTFGEYYWPVIYEVYVGEEEGSLDRAGSIRVNYPEEDKGSVEFIDDTLKGHTNYVWYVKATNVDSGNTSESEKKLFATKNTAPELSINEVVEEDYSIVITWQATDTDGDEVFFDVYMKKADEAETVLATDITDTSYTLVEPESSTEYAFRIEARDNFGGKVSEEASLVTGNTAPEITLLSPDNESQNTITRNLRFDWEAYDREGDEVEFTFVLIPPEGTEIAKQVSEQYYEVESLESLTTYKWYVEAKDDKGAEEKSDVWSFTTGNTPPDEPIAVSPEEDATDVTPYRSPVFKWFASDPDNDDLNFVLELAEDSEFDSIIATSTDYDFEDPTYVSTLTNVVLDTNKEYYWKITASDDKSETTASWKFKTFDIPPEVPELVRPEDDLAEVETVDTEFSWEAFDEDDPTLNTWIFLVKEGEDEPEVYDLGLRNAGGTEEVATIGVPLEPNTEYQWWIVVEDLSGKKAESEKRSFNTGNAAPIITFPSEKLLTMKRYGASTPLEFNWEVEDPEGEDVNVEVYFSDQRPPADVEPAKSGTNITNYTYTGELEPNKWYYFWMVAEDETGAKAEMDTHLNVIAATDEIAYNRPASEELYSDKVFDWAIKDPVEEESYIFRLYDQNGEMIDEVKFDEESAYSIEERLLGNRHYYWRIVIEENGEQRFGKAVKFYMTDIKTEFLNPIPADKSENIETDNVVLQWSYKDPDSEELYFDVYLTDRVESVFSGLTTPAATLTDEFELETNKRYTWYVVSRDNYENEATSPKWEFATINNPPTVELIEPANNATGVDVDSIAIKWEGNDADNDALYYDLFLDTKEEDMEQKLTSVTESEYNFEDYNGDTTYYWYVKVTDQKDSATSEIWSFRTGNKPPEPPRLLGPEDGKEKVGINPTLKWDCEDAEGDPLNFLIYLGESPDDMTVVTTTPKNTYEYEFDGILEGNTTYYWKVVAEDPQGRLVESETYSFTTVTVTDRIPYVIDNGLKLAIFVENENQPVIINTTINQLRNDIAPIMSGELIFSLTENGELNTYSIGLTGIEAEETMKYKTNVSPVDFIKKGEALYILDSHNLCEIYRVQLIDGLPGQVDRIYRSWIVPIDMTISRDLRTIAIAEVLSGIKVLTRQNDGTYEEVVFEDENIFGTGIVSAVSLRNRILYYGQSGSDGGLYVIDLDSLNRKPIDDYYLGSETIVKGNVLFALTDSGISAIDISIPSEPEVVNEVDISGNVNQIVVGENHIVVVTETDVIHVDISNPLNPKK